jgi:CRP-like cAMP-binding protein
MPNADSAPNASPTAVSAKEARRNLLVTFKAGQVIFQEGERGDEMFIIEIGQVEIVRRRAAEERSLVVFEAGDFFGEMSLLEDLPRSATARAVTDCRLLPVDASTFDLMLRDHPEVAIRIMRMLSRRLRQFDEMEQRAHAIAAGPLHGLSHTSMHPAADVSGIAGLAHSAAPPPPAVPAQPAAPVEAKAEVSLPAAVVTAEVKAAATPEVKAAAASAAPAADFGASRARLVHPATGTEFVLSDDAEQVVGRRDPVTGLVPEIDLTALDVQRSMSRRHARIVGRGGRFFVREEIGTANGTYLGAVRVPTGKEQELHDGDTLKLGLVELSFRHLTAGNAVA